MLVTELTRRLEIEHPIVQAGIGSGAGWQLASAVADAGALGTIGTITRTLDTVLEDIAAVRSATDAPFAVNVACFDWAPHASEILDAVIDAAPPVLTCSVGDAVAALVRGKERGIFSMVQVQDLEGLRSAIDADADAIIVQGNEAGGHTGRRGTLNFVAQALDLAGDIPSVAAGGIGNGRGLAAALAMGCAGAVIGTRFKASQEYAASDDTEKDEVVASDGSNTIYDEINDLAFGMVWPKRVTGRTLRNPFTEEWEGRQDELSSKVAEYPPFGFVLELAEQGTNINWAGESAGLVTQVQPAADIVHEATTEAERLLRGVGGLLA